MKVPASPPTPEELLKHVDTIPTEIWPVIMAMGPAPGGKYRHWDTHRRCRPPEGLSIEGAWWALKMARSSQARPVPMMKDVDGESFSYTMPDPLVTMLSRADRALSGHIGVADPLRAQHDRYLQRSVIEEAIASSQLEGAVAWRSQWRPEAIPVARVMAVSGV